MCGESRTHGSERGEVWATSLSYSTTLRPCDGPQGAEAADIGRGDGVGGEAGPGGHMLREPAGEADEVVAIAREGVTRAISGCASIEKGVNTGHTSTEDGGS